MSEEKKYGLWEYMSEQHGLTLLESEVHEIINLARKEMELPDDDEIMKATKSMRVKNPHTFALGARWALNKVRNPYPKQIHP